MVEKLKNSPFDHIFLRINSEEIRERLRKEGLSLCDCTEFNHASWLNYCPNTPICYDIHGEGYWDDDDVISMRSEEAQHNFFLYQLRESKEPYVDCGENVELFIQLIKEAKTNEKKNKEKASFVDNEYFGRYINEHHHKNINNIMADLAERFINGEEIIYNTSFGKVNIKMYKI